MRFAVVVPLFLSACAAGPRTGPGPVHFDGEATGSVGRTIRLHDLRIRPLEVVEDSRCPVDVQCIHAGFLRVRVEIRAGADLRTETMELGRGIALEDARRLALTEVSPARRQGEAPRPGEYRLTFTLGPGD